MGQQEVFNQNGEIVFGACFDAVDKIGWRIVDIDKKQLELTAIAGISWRSFRDKIEISISERKEETVLFVSSNGKIPLLPIHTYDWGQGEINETKLLDKTVAEIHRQHC